MDAIITRFRPGTDARGSRIHAKSAERPRGYTTAYDHGLSSFENHRRAAGELYVRSGYRLPLEDVRLVAGEMPSKDGYAFIPEAQSPSGTEP